MRSLSGKNVLITGAARRIGSVFALAAAREGATVIIHHGHSDQEAEELSKIIQILGNAAHILKIDLSTPKGAMDLINKATTYGPLYALVNNASIFESFTWEDTDIETWDRHLLINLTVPFLLSQSFAKTLSKGETGRIVNILDWRALRPGISHFPYTISKAGLASLTKSLAIALAPRITVNGLALGAILPPSNGSDSSNLLLNIPAKRWAELDEVGQALIFLLTGPLFITGEIFHLDGGRHLI